MDIITDMKLLRKISEKVGPDEDVTEIIRELEEHIRMENVAGLAAIQLGFPKRIIILRNFPKTPILIINPVIIKTRGEIRLKEGCLSLPGVVVDLKRPREVKVAGVTPFRVSNRWHFSMINASSACHEIDHLDGKLIIDYKRDRQ